MKSIPSLLTAAGFAMQSPVFGTIAPEPFNVAPNHFKPHFRCVFIGKAVGGYYVTSDIVGDYRGYRCRQTHRADIANIFGKGKTKRAAVLDFLANFTSKTYNVAR